LDDLLRKYQSKVREYQVRKDPQIFGAITGLVEDFIADSENPENEYLAFRRWVTRKLEALLSG